MTSKRIAKIIISAYDFTNNAEFIRTIEFLTVCMYHSDNTEIVEQIQSAIWYLQDKNRNLNKSSQNVH